jgi:signal transduction histidine kinase
MGFLELLSDTGLDPVQTEYVNDTKSAANTLLCLLNDILDYSKAEPGCCSWSISQ